MSRTKLDLIHASAFIENPAGKGIVVFIHGFMGSPRQFDRLTMAVYRQGFSAAALLLPGHGGPASEFKSSTFPGWQEHVDSEVERFSRDYQKIWLAGHSMGGLLALNAAVRYSGHVRGVFPIACPFKMTMFSAHTIKIRMQQVFSRSSSPIKAAYRDGSSIKLSPSLIWSTAKPAFELSKLITTAKDNLPKVRAPVMAVYSVSDELTSIASLEILKSGLKGAAFEQIILSDSLHAYYPEHEFSVIERSLVGFIQ